MRVSVKLRKGGSQMGRSREDFIEKTGGYRVDEPMSFDQSHGMTIRELENRLKSGNLALEDAEKVRKMICNLKGLPPDEWDYETG